jgi:hypothetical protein
VVAELLQERALADRARSVEDHDGLFGQARAQHAGQPALGHPGQGLTHQIRLPVVSVSARRYLPLLQHEFSVSAVTY